MDLYYSRPPKDPQGQKAPDGTILSVYEYRNPKLANKDEIIEMALSDKVSFNTIKELFGLDQNQVKLLIKAELKPGSYKAWRKRVEKFSARRDVYK